MIHKNIRFFCFILIIFSLSSCTLISKHITSDQKKAPSKPLQNSKKTKKDLFEKKIFFKAKEEVSSKPLTNKRVKQLKTILKNKKSFISKEKIKIILGHHFFLKKSYKKALLYYSQVKHYPSHKLLILREAKIYYRIGKYKKALKQVNFLLEADDLSPESSAELYLLKLNLTLKKKDPDKKELLEIYCHILNHENTNSTDNRKKVKDIIFGMDEKDILDIKSESYIEPVKDLVFYRAGKVLFYREKFKQSYFLLKKFLRFSTDSSLEEKALKYIQAIESRKKVKRKYIGAILPLSGPSANIGERSLKGLKAGLDLYTNKRSAFQLIVLDSQGQADKARKAVQRLVTKYHVIAIVGGVLSRTSTAVAEEAQNFGIPTVLMSQKSNLTQKGHYIFQNGLTTSLVSDQLTEYLIHRLKIKKFAILYPNDPYGLDYANAFWSSVEKKGGKITGAQFYKPGETDFNGPIKRLIGTYYLKDRTKEYKEKLKTWYSKKTYSNKQRALPPKDILPPIVDFDCLFIPDSIKTLSLIAPHIVYNDIKNIKLAGPNLWNQKKVLKKHSKYMNNIIFADLGLSTNKFKQTSFYKDFHLIFNYKPGFFEVQAYESALALRQVIASGADTRNELRKGLENLKDFYGPIGKINVSRERVFLRPLQIFKMEENKLSLITSLKNK